MPFMWSEAFCFVGVLKQVGLYRGQLCVHMYWTLDCTIVSWSDRAGQCTHTVCTVSKSPNQSRFGKIWEEWKKELQSLGIFTIRYISYPTDVIEKSLLWAWFTTFEVYPTLFSIVQYFSEWFRLIELFQVSYIYLFSNSQQYLPKEWQLLEFGKQVWLKKLRWGEICCLYKRGCCIMSL